MEIIREDMFLKVFVIQPVLIPITSVSPNSSSQLLKTQNLIFFLNPDLSTWPNARNNETRDGIPGIQKCLLTKGQYTPTGLYIYVYTVIYTHTHTHKRSSCKNCWSDIQYLAHCLWVKYLSLFHWNDGEDGAMDTYECRSLEGWYWYWDEGKSAFLSTWSNVRNNETIWWYSWYSIFFFFFKEIVLSYWAIYTAIYTHTHTHTLWNSCENCSNHIKYLLHCLWVKYLSSFHWNGGGDGATGTCECSSREGWEERKGVLVLTEEMGV